MPTRRPTSQANEAPGRDAHAQNGAARFPVVGLGASAGGLEAATAFFKELSPRLGIAYVLVLHLDPARESRVTEILSRATPMSVFQVEDGMTVAPDQVYVIPPNCEMTIDRTVLHLQERELHRSANTTIDTFLRSLAVTQTNDAIGVILSGTASDGTLGLEAIKGEGVLPSPRNPPPPSTMACRRAPSIPVVSTSFSLPRASPRRSLVFVAIRTSLTASIRRYSR